MNQRHQACFIDKIFVIALLTDRQQLSVLVTAGSIYTVNQLITGIDVVSIPSINIMCLSAHFAIIHLAQLNYSLSYFLDLIRA